MSVLTQSLARTTDGTALIPGDPVAIRADAARMEGLATDLSTCGAAVSCTDLSGWTGAAHDAYVAGQGDLATRLAVAATSMRSAATALSQYAAVVEQAQFEAGLYARRWHNAAACVVPEPGVLGPTLAPEQINAQAQYDQLTSAVDAVARSTAALVEAATVDAPINPGFWNAVGYALTHLGHGVVDTGAAAWMFVRDHNMIRWLYDPAGALEVRKETVENLLIAIQDPRQFVASLIDLDTWRNDPWRAAGRLLPDLALALYTGGTVTAAVRGARAGSQVSMPAAFRGAVAGGARATWANSTLVAASRAMSTSVSGFWNGRVLAINWADDTGMLDITAFYPNPRTPSTAAARIADAERQILRFEGTNRQYVATMIEGRRFNFAREGGYDFDEVTIRQPDGTYRYLDSYTPGEAVVSRKTTQLAAVSEGRVRDIIDEFDKKYRPDSEDFIIADTPVNRVKFADSPQLLGKPVEGRMVLEVPVQAADVPAWARQYAADRSVLIRDAAGNELNRVELDARDLED